MSCYDYNLMKESPKSFSKWAHLWPFMKMGCQHAKMTVTQRKVGRKTADHIIRKAQMARGIKAKWWVETLIQILTAKSIY